MSIILHTLCRDIGFSKRGTAPLKEGLDIWKCTLHSFKRHGATFQGILHILLRYGPCKHMPQRKINYSYSEGYVCFEYCICWQAWGCCNYVETIKSSSIFCRNCVLLKGHCSSIYPYKVKWTPGHFFKQYMLSSRHEHSFICSLSFDVITVLKQHIKQCTPTASCSLFFGVLRVNDVISCIFFLTSIHWISVISSAQVKQSPIQVSPGHSTCLTCELDKDWRRETDGAWAMI